MKIHGNCAEHIFRTIVEVVRSIGRVEVELCNNCLSVQVVQKRSSATGYEDPATTTVQMDDSAYRYVE